MTAGRWFAALCGVIVGWAVVMCALEPVMLDGWFITFFEGDFLDYARANRAGELFYGNARLGQLATGFTYTPTVHVVVTPLVVLALFTLMLVLVRGRRPVAGDAWLLLVIVALTVLAQPQLGPVLFYRPYAANYLFGLVVQLAWMVPYRFAVAGTIDRTPLAIPGMLVLGFAAGMCNEHTGPALLVAGAIISWRTFRAPADSPAIRRAWMLAGLAGFVAGYLALMLAPAQATRYCGIVELSLVDRVADRGLAGTLWIGLAMFGAGRWLWLATGLTALAVRRYPARWREAAAWLGLGFAISLTLLASPKQGDRLLFAPLVFSTIGMAILVDGFGERARRVFAVVAGLVVAGAIAWSIAVQWRVHTDHEARLDTIAAQVPGATVRVPMLRDGDSRWFLGDDLRSDHHRHYIAQLFRLAAIELEGHPTIAYHYEIHDGALTRRLPPVQQLCEARRDFAAATRTGELAVVPQPRILDGRPLAAARWRADRLVAPSATVVHERGYRWITLDRNGLDGPLDVILVGPGREQRLTEDAGRWPYRPWANGAYWIVACAGTDCYLVEAVRHTQV